MINISNFPRHVYDAASDFEQRGWRKVKVPFGSKKANSEGWQNTDPKPQDFRSGQFNIGVQLGPKSGGLVDIDLDCPQAIELADAFFPELRNAAFGRLNPDGRHTLGHRLVICSDIPEASAKPLDFGFTKPEEQAAIKAIGLQKTKLVEFRAGKGYTVFPPSCYGDEQLTWRQRPATVSLVPDIPELPFADAYRRAALLAFASLALAVYPQEGGRDDFCLQLAGALIHAGVEPDAASKIIIWVATAAGDEEASRRGEKARRTADKKDEGEPVTNLSTFLAHVGLEVCEKAVRKWLGLPGKTVERDKPRRPLIEIKEGDIKLDGPNKVDRINAMTERLLARDNIGGIYIRGDNLVRFNNARELQLVSPTWLAHRLQEVGTRFYRTDQYMQDYFCDCNEQAVLPLIATADQRPFRKLKGIVRMATLTRNEPGWDEATGLYGSFDEAYDAPLQPSKEQAVDALAFIAELLAYFPFVRLESEPEDPVVRKPAERQDLSLPRAARSVALSGMLSAAIRGDLDDCPVHVTDAPAFGSGKTKIAHMWGVIALGNVPDFTPWSGRESDNEKNLTAMLATGTPFTLFDNVEEQIKGKTIGACITSPAMKTRILGYNDRHITVSTRTLIAFSGANVSVASDMVRRTLVCRFDHGVESPDQLKFPFDPVKRLLGDLKKYREACLTVMRAYIHAGMPGYEDLPSDGSFPSWRIVRGALVWLGQADPWGVVEVTRKADPELMRKIQVYIALFQGPGVGTPFACWQLRNYLADKLPMRLSPIDRLAMQLPEQEWSEKSGGKLLGRYKDQVCHGLVLRQKPGNRWVLEGEPDEAFVEMAEAI